jgi:hypothetical protein
MGNISPSKISIRQVETWLVLVACVAMAIWYARPQIFYSLSFLYYLGRALFPEIVPKLK